MQGRTRPRVVVLVGDGELDEGSNVEAIQYAARAGLGNLTAVVVDNESAAARLARRHRGPVRGRGLGAPRDVDGHDLRRPGRATRPPAAAPRRPSPTRRPHVVVAHVEPEEEA